MLAYVLFGRVEQIRQLLLREPNIIVFKPSHDSRLSGIRTEHRKPPRRPGRLMLSLPIPLSVVATCCLCIATGLLPFSNPMQRSHFCLGQNWLLKNSSCKKWLLRNCCSKSGFSLISRLTKLEKFSVSYSNNPIAL